MTEMIRNQTLSKEFFSDFDIIFDSLFSFSEGWCSLLSIVISLFFSVFSPRVMLGLGILLSHTFLLVPQPVMGSHGCVVGLLLADSWGLCWVSGKCTKHELLFINPLVGPQKESGMV